MVFNTDISRMQYCDGDSWIVVGPDQDVTPNAFNFTDQTGVTASTVITSNSVTIDGLEAPVAVSVSGAGSPQIRINGGSWAASGTIANGQTLEVRLTSHASFGTANIAAVLVGGFTEQWSVTTVGQDTTPNAFSFTDATAQALNTLITSNSATINGITGTVAVSVSGAGSPQVRVNGGSWAAGPTTITNGQTLEVRLTSANADTTMRSATVTVGTVSDQWDVTTNDNSPTGLTFTDVTAQALNTLITSNSATINGITGTVAVSVSGAGSPEVRVNGGSWTVGPTTITNGQTLEVRLTSANANSTLRSATVTVGTGSDQWDVTTILPPATLAYVGSTYDAVNRATYTYSSAPLGTAAADREVIAVIVTGDRNTTGVVTSVTIAGQTATLRGSSVGALTAQYYYSANIPTGTTGNIVVNWNTTVTDQAVAVYRATSLNSTTPVSNSSESGLGTSSSESNVTVPDGGFIIATCAVQSVASLGITVLTEDVEYAAETGRGNYASKTYTTGATPTIVTSWSGGQLYRSFTMAWR